jgi:hypothetical protein
MPLAVMIQRLGVRNNRAFIPNDEECMIVGINVHTEAFFLGIQNGILIVVLVCIIISLIRSICTCNVLNEHGCKMDVKWRWNPPESKLLAGAAVAASFVMAYFVMAAAEEGDDKEEKADEMNEAHADSPLIQDSGLDRTLKGVTSLKQPCTHIRGNLAKHIFLFFMLLLIAGGSASLPIIALAEAPSHHGAFWQRHLGTTSWTSDVPTSTPTTVAAPTSESAWMNATNGTCTNAPAGYFCPSGARYCSAGYRLTVCTMEDSTVKAFGTTSNKKMDQLENAKDHLAPKSIKGLVGVRSCSPGNTLTTVFTVSRF